MKVNSQHLVRLSPNNFLLPIASSMEMRGEEVCINFNNVDYEVKHVKLVTKNR